MMKWKLEIFSQKTYKYLFEFIVVFAGVFLAFALSEYKDKKNEAEKKREIYITIFEDLDSFYKSGRTENEGGFVNIFNKNQAAIDSAILSKELPVSLNIYADSWYVPMINSLITSGLLKDIDTDVFKTVTKFNSGHQIFLEHIRDFNEYYEKYITANSDLGLDFIYRRNECAET